MLALPQLVMYLHQHVYVSACVLLVLTCPVQGGVPVCHEAPAARPG